MEVAVVGGPLVGGEGDDFLIGDASELSVGVDNYSNSGSFALRGNGGNDILVGDIYDPLGPDTEGDEMFGGSGNDRMYGDAAPDLTEFGVSTEFDGDPASASFGSGDTMEGGAGNDIMLGGGGFDTIYGGSGKDKIHGQGDTDYLYGESGRDGIWGGGGDDQVYGGAGADTVLGDDGNDGLYGEAFGSSAGDGGDTIRGGDGNDDIEGGAGADRLYGDTGDDTIRGGGLFSDQTNDLADLCIGGKGNDVIYGDFGSDSLYGGAGQDHLHGGADADYFHYEGTSDSRKIAADVIWDFDANGGDMIDLSAVDAIVGGGDNVFTFRGSKQFNAAGQVRFYSSGSDTIIDINTEGTGGAEMRIVIKGIVTLGGSDFDL